MDKVRLGRALGYGTRHAAKTLAAVAEAAAAADPGIPANRTETPAAPPKAEVHTHAAVPRPAQATPPQRRAAVRTAGRSMWGPLAAFSGALWLRVTGLFFAVIALTMASGAWRVRGALRGPSTAPSEMRHFLIFCGFFVLFGYFAGSSFLRAARRERRAAAPSPVPR